MIKIEKNIPYESPTKWKDILSDIEIGDSFVIENDTYKRNAVFNAGYALGYKLTTKKISHNEIRVWRKS